MAVRAQYPPNVLLRNRVETDEMIKETDADFAAPLPEQSHLFFSSNGGNANRRKRGKETALPKSSQKQQIIFSLHQQSRAPSHVSTGLRLALDEQKNSQIKREQPDSLLSAHLSEDLAAQINREKSEIDQFLIAHWEQLRRALAERQQRLYRTLLESAGKRLLEKETEIDRAVRCNAELESQLIRIQTESMTWQAKAMADHAAASSLQSQLQKAAAAAAAAAAASATAAAQGGPECCDEFPAEDAESAYIDPDRSEGLERSCRSCRRRPAAVVLLPCCHLCVCTACDSTAAVGEGCPACGCFRTGRLHVNFT